MVLIFITQLISKCFYTKCRFCSVLWITFSNIMVSRIAGTVDAIMMMAIQLLIGSVPLVTAAYAQNLLDKVIDTELNKLRKIGTFGDLFTKKRTSLEVD